MQDAEHAVADEQRDAEQRADAARAQDRAVELSRIDLLEHDRLPLDRDPPGEALAERDPHALLVEPHRRAHDELVALEQQERGDVGVQDVDDPHEQLVQLQPPKCVWRPHERRS